MTFLKKNLANIFTLGNLFSGSIGVVHLIDGDYRTAAVCIIISLILDFFDGFVARLTKTSSNLGGQLDSLADMVSFGLLPGIAMYMALEPFGSELLGVMLPFEIKYLAFFITVFSCLRLAIFNIDDEQKYYFKGLNTPSNTVLIFGLYYVFMESGTFEFLFDNSLLLLLLTALSSWLLISPIKMIAMKFKSMKPVDNYPKIALLLGGILLLIIFGMVGIPLVILYYMIISLVFQKQLR
jgi:CDP-diacylglycerol--serine O-phosphatidyltransferase